MFVVLLMLQEAKHHQAKCSQKGQAVTQQIATRAVPVESGCNGRFSCGPIEHFIEQGLALCHAAVQAEFQTAFRDCCTAAAAHVCSQELTSGTAIFQVAH